MPLKKPVFYLVACKQLSTSAVVLLQKLLSEDIDNKKNTELDPGGEQQRDGCSSEPPSLEPKLREETGAVPEWMEVVEFEGMDLSSRSSHGSNPVEGEVR
ncbi:hypothetical protein HOLleu_44474 [Holothuria leucospilota]|uniref:Uncharacterized protein n=1 Tax=Holothuria leucospilota TaxID=206669 RepID=A0A9Q0YAF6_HOLLE|nr:hypothetical protein HOLleu_44474 [Holothuria leucospilota]